MSHYQPPLKDFEFVLHKLLKVHEMNLKGYEDLAPEYTKTILEEAGKIASDELAPLNRIGDLEGCTLENGIVRTPTGFKQAFKKLMTGDGRIVPSTIWGRNYLSLLLTIRKYFIANMSLNMD